MKFKKRANYRYIRLCPRISIGLVHRLLPTYPYSDPDVCRISSKTLRIHYLVGVSHFAECYDCMRDADKPPKIPYSAMVVEVDSDSESVSETGSPPKVEVKTSY